MKMPGKNPYCITQENNESKEKFGTFLCNLLSVPYMAKILSNNLYYLPSIRSQSKILKYSK